MALVLIKFKPAYMVNLAGEELGYISNKDEIEDSLNEYVNNKQGCVVDINIAEKPTYEFTLVSLFEPTNKEKILEKIEENSIITYRMFAIKLNGEVKEYVESLEEAEEVVSAIKGQNENKMDIDLSIEEIYTEESLELSEIEIAKAELEEAYDTKVQEMKLSEALEMKKEINNYTSRSINASRISKEKVDLGAVTLIKPINGIITSKFGSISSLRLSAHKGLDIAAPRGTDIKAAETGLVTFAGTDSWLGNVVIIAHTDGVETCYAHCSKLYVSVGDTVKQGDVIAAVGSTGNSTGNHLHFEIRKDGVALNPEKYVY